MKTFKSTDFFSHTWTEKIFLVRRPDAKLPIAKDELPAKGEVVEMDGNLVTVERAMRIGDSAFGWWPEIAITVIFEH